MEIVENKLSFFVPASIDLLKSRDSGEEVRRIRGYASNSHMDRQQEEIVQKGLDISDFVDYGWFNYDHDNTKILGYPDKELTRIDQNGFYVEGNLLKGVPLADEVWNLAVALNKSGAPRRLGFSVEGKVLQKSYSGKILKAKVFNVAITPNPVNPGATWEAVLKSFSGGKDFEFINKAEAGYECSIGDRNNGSVLKKESLEESLKNLSYLVGDIPGAKEKLEELKSCLAKRPLSKSEATLYLQISKGLSYEQANEICDKLYQKEVR